MTTTDRPDRPLSAVRDISRAVRRHDRELDGDDRLERIRGLFHDSTGMTPDVVDELVAWAERDCDDLRSMSPATFGPLGEQLVAIAAAADYKDEYERVFAAWFEIEAALYDLVAQTKAWAARAHSMLSAPPAQGITSRASDRWWEIQRTALGLTAGESIVSDCGLDSHTIIGIEAACTDNTEADCRG